MEIKRVECRRVFQAKGEWGGVYKVGQYVPIIDASTEENPKAEIPGPVEYKTEGGLKVVWLGGKQYRIIKTREILDEAD